MRRSTRHGRCAILAAATSSVLTLAVPLSAATVTFEPSALTVQQGETAHFNLTVSESLLFEFDFIEMYPQLDPPEPYTGFFMSFDYAPGFLDSTDFVYLCQLDCFVLGIGGFQFSSPGFAPPLPMGTLNVSTTSFSPGTYSVLVSSSLELDRFGAAFSGLRSGLSPIEPLEGRATLTIIPEPASLRLLAIGATWLKRKSLVRRPLANP